jgi:hypothetical protein
MEKKGFVLIMIGFCSVLSWAAAPQVVRTIPENGDMNVKPGMVKVRIQFNQDMSKGMSITGGGENFPDIVGDPKWVSKRVIAFTAKLKPNHEYEFGINSRDYKNFKNVRGEPAEVYRVYFKTTAENGTSDANDPSVNQLTTQGNESAIKELKAAVTRNYSYNELKGIDWNAAFAKYEPKLLNAKNPEEFARITGALLATAKDKHIWMMVGDKQIPSYVNPSNPNANFEILPQLVPNFQKRNDIIYTGRFTNGIGYILIDSWSGDDDDLKLLLASLKEVAAAPGLIIDVRGNGGGSEPMAQKFAGCFVDAPVLYAKHQVIEPDDPNGFGPVRSRYLMPNEDAPKYRGKIAILVGPAVMSSCESFVLMMKQIKGCKIIGETTQGSSGNPQPHDLGNGVTVYLPCWKDLLPDGTCFEGKGIRPDKLVKTTPQQITTTDPVIEAALQELSK